MEQGAICRRGQSGRFYSYERLAAIGFGLLAVFSPLYIDRRQEPEEEVDLESWLPPLLLMVLVVAIALSRSSDRSLCRLDPYWIHRVVGSSVGIAVILIVLALVLKCKSYFMLGGGLRERGSMA